MVPPDPVLELTATRGRVTLRLRAQRLGDDLSVTISGGDRPHIGAVAVSQPRPSHDPGKGTGATTSVITILGHREDELARTAAGRIAATLGATTCVACGVHVEQIRPAEIRDVEELADTLVGELLERLAGRSQRRSLLRRPAAAATASPSPAPGRGAGSRARAAAGRRPAAGRRRAR